MGPCTTPCCGYDKFAESEFEKVQSCKANGLVPVTKYISKSTGLVVFHAEVEGPIVSGYICVVTRVENDDGLPHILEHMVFLGSEDYPYPGVLDKLANKCLANGTNAWTDVDHTCYSLSTAGSDGFCQLLPIYFDHIFYPLLTDAAYKTEVHHITARGTDAGKIYSEMQAQESNAFCKATNVLHKILFSPGSGYHWNVGGEVKNLRENCTNEKVKAYHKAFYHPRNTCLVVCGNIQAKQVFGALYQPIKKLRKHSPKVSYINPNSSQISTENYGKQLWATESRNINSINASTEITVHIPVMEDEGGGCIAVIGFLGPSCLHSYDLEEAVGLVLILKYLTAISSSPLQKALVEKESRLATSLEFVAAEQNRSVIFFELEGVNPNDKNKIASHIRECLKDQTKKFDMARMTDVIKSNIQQQYAIMEKAPHDSIAEAIMKEFIYGAHEEDREPSTFRKRLDGIGMLENFLTKPETYWKGIIKDYLLTKHWAAVFVEPSTKLYSEIMAQNEERVYKRRSILGSKGLATCAIELDHALLLNLKPAPNRIIKKVKAPSIKSIQYHKLIRMQNPSWISPKDFPANICLDDINTKFVHVLVVMDTTELDDCFREYLPLFKDTIVNTDFVTEDGKKTIPYDEAVASRYRELQTCQLNIGLEMVDFSEKENTTTKFSSGSFSHLLTLLIQMEISKVDIGMDWIRKILWKTKWQMERIQLVASKLAGEAFLLRQEGSVMCQVLLKNLIYDKTSNVAKAGLLNQVKFLNGLGSDNNSKFKSCENQIRTAFDSILSVITDVNNLSLHISANMKLLRDELDCLPCGSLGNLLRNSFPFQLCSVSAGGCHSKVERHLANTFDVKWMLSPEKLSKRSEKNQIIYGIVNADSSYMTMVGPGVTSYEDSELPALLTLLQYLNQVKGPVYHEVKGRDFGYSDTSALRVNEGLIYFHLTRCIDLVSAYEGILGVIVEHQSKSAWSSELLISAKNSLIFECLETERTPFWLACNSCLAYYRRVPGTYVQTLISKIAKVSLKDLKKMLTKYFAPMFLNPQKNYATAIVCHLDQVEIIKEGFARFGKHFRVFTAYDELMKGLNDSDDE